MKTSAKWLLLLCAVGVGFSVAACDEESPTSVQEVTAPTTTADASAADEAAPTAPADIVIQGTDVWGDCLNEDINDPPDGTRFNNATCTANDVEIKVLTVLEVDGQPVTPGQPITCVEGSELELKLEAYFGLNATERYDIGYYFAEDGGDAKIGDCFHGFLEPIDKGGSGNPTGKGGDGIFNGPYADYEADDANDVCGDAAEADEVNVPGVADEIAAVIEVPETITITCEDPDDDGFVSVGTCTSWDNNDKETCEDVDGAVPGTPAKCNCRPAPLPINVRRQATVKVVKDLVPDADPGTFDFVIKDWEGTTVASVDGVGDGGFVGPTTIQWFRNDEPTKNKASVAEPGANLGSLNETTTPSAFDFYTTTYSCVENNNSQTPVSGSGKGPVNLTLANNDAWVCTFTNTRIQVPTVTVSKTANTTYDKTWDWTITKKAYFTANDQEIPSGTILGAGPPIALPGMVYDVYYKVEGAPTPTESNFKVSGVITVTVAGSFPPYSGNFTVTDVLTGATNLVVDCDPGEPVDNTKTVTAAGSFTCDYSADLPDKTARTNTATAAVTWNSGDTDSQNGTASVTFGAPTNEIDETAYVCDDKGPTLSVSDPCTTSSGDYLGTATAPSSYSFRYDNDLPACVPPGFDRLNTALLTEVDTDTDRTANHALSSVCQEPPPGCTLTQGYWKTHSEFGPAPYDDNWANLSSGASTLLFGADTWYITFWTAPKGGNPYYQLAHQWMAAYLNVLNGAGTTAAVDQALTDGAALLATYAAQQKIPKKTVDGDAAKDIASLLAQYNEGAIGPGHCDDDYYPDLLFF